MSEKLAGAVDSAVSTSHTSRAEAEPTIAPAPSLDGIAAASRPGTAMNASRRAATMTSAQGAVGTARLNRLMNPPVGPDRRTPSLQATETLPVGAAEATRAPTGGQPLETSVRGPAERAVGADLSYVRVHTGPEANAAAESLSARAFTTGKDIFLGPGESPTDTRLIAHEAAHVVHGQGDPRIRKYTPAGGDEQEVEARRVEGVAVRDTLQKPDPERGSVASVVPARGSQFRSTSAGSLIGTAPPGPTRAPTSGPASPSGQNGQPALSVAAPSAPAVAPAEGDGGGILGTIRRRIAAIVGGLQTGWNSLTRDAADAVSVVEERMGAASSGLTSVAEGAIAGVQRMWSTARTTAAGLAQGLTSTLGRALSGLTGAVGTIKQALLNLDGDALSAAWHGLTGLVAGAWSILKAGGTALRQRLAGLWGDLQGGFSVAVTHIATVGRAFVDGVQSAASGAAARLSSMWERLTSQASSLTGESEGLATRALRAVIAPIVSAGQRVWGAIQGQWQGLRERTRGLLNGVGNRARSTYAALERRTSTMWGGIRAAWTGIRTRASATADRLLGGVGGLWARIRGLPFTGFISKLTRHGALIRKIEAGVANPEGMVAPLVDGIVQRLSATPAKAAEVIQQKGAEAGVTGAQAMGPGAAAAAAPGATAGRSSPSTPGPVAQAGGMPSTAMRGITAGVAQASPTQMPPTPGGPAPLGAQVVGMPAPTAARELRGTATWSEVAHGILQVLSDKWRDLDVKKAVWDALVSLVLPWRAIGPELAAMWKEWTEAAGSFYAPRNLLSDPLGSLHDLYSNLLRVLDFLLILAHHLMQIAMALMGWVTIILIALGALFGAGAGTVVGGIAGALAGFGIGAAPGAGAGAAGGGFAGAGAGFAVAMGVGLVLVRAYMVTEGVNLVMALVELKTSLQTPEEQTRDYNQAANSGIGLVIVGLLMLLAYLAGRIAAVAVSRLARVVPDAVRQAASRFAAGVRSVRRPPPPAGQNRPPAVDPNAPPAVVPNQPPAVDPNAPPAVDPNRPPAVDPNRPPAVDPNRPPPPPNPPAAYDPTLRTYEELLQDEDPDPRPGETEDQALNRAVRAEAELHARRAAAVPARPPSVDMAVEENRGGHTLDHHGPNIELERQLDPAGNPNGVKTIEGRVYGDQPWRYRVNKSGRWSSMLRLNQVVNRFLRANWEAVRTALIGGGEYEHTFDADGPVGDAYYNTRFQAPGGAQNPVAAHVPDVWRVTITIEYDPAGPPGFRVVRAYPDPPVGF